MPGGLVSPPCQSGKTGVVVIENEIEGVDEMYIKDYDKDDFLEMIRDWQADGTPEYDELEIRDPQLVDGKWEAIATDDKQTYSLTDDGSGNIQINYIGTK